MHRRLHISRSALRALGIVLVLSSAAACTRMERFHGFAPSDTDLATVQVGQTTKDAVLASFGPPISDGTLDNNALYYASSTFVHFGPFAPEETDRQVVAIRFDSNDVVQNVVRYTLEDGQVVALDRRVTDDGISDVTLLQQLMRSFGRFNAGQLLGEEPSEL
ncbi:MAG: outer membrane protein assembly factor BamE [Pseudomonadota bacterium]